MNFKYFYKYRKIIKQEDLASDPNIKALFNCYVMLSSRKNFEDKEDSKINFMPLKKQHVSSLFSSCPINRKRELCSLFDETNLNKAGRKKLIELNKNFEDLIDNYMIYCLASYGNSDEMWKSYADNHQGFCIEFNAAPIEGLTEVKYKNNIGKMNSVILFKNFFIQNYFNLELAKRVHKLLHVKKLKYKFEGEYRFINTGLLSEYDEKSVRIKKYENNHVASVIFGADMPQEHKQYIMDNIPFPVAFKQARIIQSNSGSNVILENLIKISTSYN